MPSRYYQDRPTQLQEQVAEALQKQELIQKYRLNASDEPPIRF